MEIRNFVTADRKNVVSLWNETFPKSTGHNEPESSIDRKVKANDGLFFVATDGDKIVGTILAGYDGHRGWLYSVAVDSSFRRRGIGSKLVRHAESVLAELGCPKLNLQVRATHSSVGGFYKSLGFQIEERISMGKILGE